MSRVHLDAKGFDERLSGHEQDQAMAWIAEAAPGRLAIDVEALTGERYRIFTVPANLEGIEHVTWGPHGAAVITTAVYTTIRPPRSVKAAMRRD